MNVALYPKEWVERHVHSIGVRDLRVDVESGSGGAQGLEVGGGADAEAGGFLVEEAGRSQILRGQAE